eukprot:scaffold279385_cov18-Tisochrysis_lutea.AAC.1
MHAAASPLLHGAVNFGGGPAAHGSNMAPCPGMEGNDSMHTRCCGHPVAHCCKPLGHCTKCKTAPTLTDSKPSIAFRAPMQAAAAAAAQAAREEEERKRAWDMEQMKLEAIMSQAGGGDGPSLLGLPGTFQAPNK